MVVRQDDSIVCLDAKKANSHKVEGLMVESCPPAYSVQITPSNLATAISLLLSLEETFHSYYAY